MDFGGGRLGGDFGGGGLSLVADFQRRKGRVGGGAPEP